MQIPGATGGAGAQPQRNPTFRADPPGRQTGQRSQFAALRGLPVSGGASPRTEEGSLPEITELHQSPLSIVQEQLHPLYGMKDGVHGVYGDVTGMMLQDVVVQLAPAVLSRANVILKVDRALLAAQSIQQSQDPGFQSARDSLNQKEAVVRALKQQFQALKNEARRFLTELPGPRILILDRETNAVLHDISEGQARSHNQPHWVKLMNIARDVTTEAIRRTHEPEPQGELPRCDVIEVIRLLDQLGLSNNDDLNSIAETEVR